MVEDGRLPTRQVGRRRLVPTSAIDASQRQRDREARTRTSATRPTPSTPTIPFPTDEPVHRERYQATLSGPTVANPHRFLCGSERRRCWRPACRETFPGYATVEVVRRDPDRV